MARSVLTARGLVAILLPVSAAGCRPEPVPADVRPPRAAPATVAAALPDRDWARVELRGVGLVVELPDSHGWSRVPAGPDGFHARHTTGAELQVRAWRDVRSVTPEACWDRARLAWPELPVPGDDGLIDDRPLHAPPGFRGRVLATVVPVAAGVFEGRLGAAGAGVGRCFALLFTARVGGVGAEAAIADDLALVASGTVERLRQLTVEERVRPATVLP